MRDRKQRISFSHRMERFPAKCLMSAGLLVPSSGQRFLSHPNPHPAGTQPDAASAGPSYARSCWGVSLPVGAQPSQRRLTMVPRPRRAITTTGGASRGSAQAGSDRRNASARASGASTGPHGAEGLSYPDEEMDAAASEPAQPPVSALPARYPSPPLYLTPSDKGTPAATPVRNATGLHSRRRPGHRRRSMPAPRRHNPLCRRRHTS
jgi:hypothetical protein